VCSSDLEAQCPAHSHYIIPEQAGLFNALLNHDTSQPISSAMRKHLLNKLIEFYELHLPSFGGLRSPEILHEVLKD